MDIVPNRPAVTSRRAAPCALLLAMVFGCCHAADSATAAGRSEAYERTAAAATAKRPDRARAGGRLRRADADGDGYLSRAEAARGAPRLAKIFDAVDANGDGRLSPQEIRSHARGAGRRWPAGESKGSAASAAFARADADGDGHLSRAEAEAALPRVARKFERMDADRDGLLSAAEFQSWLERRRAARASRR